MAVSSESGKNAVPYPAGKSFGPPAVKKRSKRSHPARAARRVPDGGMEKLYDLGLALALTAAAAFIFYRSVWGMAAGILVIPYVMRMRQTERREKEQREMTEQFCMGMQAAAGALSAGYSAESAFAEAERELQKLYGRENRLCREFALMNKKVGMNEPVDAVFLETASRLGVEDILQFAEIFRYVKRSGGNLTAIIRDTVTRMREKTEILEDIRIAVAEKKSEQRLMMLLLPGVVLFISISSPQYAAALYHCASGILVMTVCLAGYLFAVWWSGRIMAIRV